ncbi:hypothetical protein [Variovorax sp. RCC_210]|uniref:hypothetical protein n=1 Tax=Variovorax sp. RCC_210 TaxID=3239217 RepID=UPI003523EA42
MNKSKGNSGQYEVRLTTVVTTSTTWIVSANSEGHAEKRVRTMNLGLLHEAQTDWDSGEEEFVTVRRLASIQEVSHE